MNLSEHRAAALKLLTEADSAWTRDPDGARFLMSAAQVHATLAMTAAAPQPPKRVEMSNEERKAKMLETMGRK